MEIDESRLLMMLSTQKRVVILQDLSLSVNTSDLGIGGFAFKGESVLMWIKKGDRYLYQEYQREFDNYLHPALGRIGKKLSEWVAENVA